MMTKKECAVINNQEISARDQWLDKLWFYLFDGDNSGLMSPGQIRRENRNRDRVRQIEMGAILEAEQEINSIHLGLKSIDDNGNLIDTPPADTIVTHSIIENTAIEQDLDLGLETPAAMIRSVVKELSVRDLERSLNLRKIAIQAETEILNRQIECISPNPVNAQWISRWRECAENVLNPELHTVWAGIVIDEIASPGSYSLGLMATLSQLNPEDLESLRIVSKYAFPGFIYQADKYFSTDYHLNLFEVMEELGLLIAHSSDKVFPSETIDNYSLCLPCNNKALKISADRSDKQLVIPVLKLTRSGRQLMSLFSSDADLAYMFDLAYRAKEQGFEVTLGDWVPIHDKGQFSEKIRL